jgi:hypothetical protein
MIRPFPPSYQPAARSARNSMQTTKGVTDFLRAHDKMAPLLPTITRMAALQKDCAALLPAIFEKSAVVQFESGQLVLSVPNAALAAKLKQQLPKLQDGLQKRNWQVSSIRLKLQPGNISVKKCYTKQLALPAQALSAMAVLNMTLEDSPRNDALKAAITAMLNRHRKAG